MQKCIFLCIRPFDWLAAIVLKDTYFHVSTPLDTDHFLRLRSKGEPISTRSPLRAPQPVEASGQLGKEQTHPLHRGSLFLALSWTRSTSQHIFQ